MSAHTVKTHVWNVDSSFKCDCISSSIELLEYTENHCNDYCTGARMYSSFLQVRVFRVLCLCCIWNDASRLGCKTDWMPAIVST